MSALRPEAIEPLLFGMERELEYTGHITQVMHLVPLPRRIFASADETHIRVWGQEGDIQKKTFPSNQRSMVTAMAFCPTFSALITTEVDMALKLYTIEKLELIDTFSLQQGRKSGRGGEKVRATLKVSAVVYFPQHRWVIVGGDAGSDVYHIEKGTNRRAHPVDVHEYHLKMDWIRQVTPEPVSRVVMYSAEHRVLVWGPTSLHVFDMDLVHLVGCRKPHSGPVCSACIHVASSAETVLLSGGAEGHVNFWALRDSAALKDKTKVDEGISEAAAVEDRASLRLQHSFAGHSRAVEAVNFYNRLQHNVRQRLCVSHARDAKMKVWSLEHFTLVYTLDQHFLDSRSSIFSLAPHFFAVSSTSVAQDGRGKSATVTLVRFTAHLSTPFATTNHSPVVSIAQPPVEAEGRPAAKLVPQAEDTHSPSVAKAAAIISEDMAIRVVDTSNAGVIATLPPPPNSKVQVLGAFICPVWQLLVLWLSSEEIAIFFIPTGTFKGPAFKRATSNTPLLLRRFGIVEVCTEVLDRDLPNEAFHSVALHHGWPLPAQDSLVSWTLDRKVAPVVDESAPSPESDWFLVVGTEVGTVQAFLLSDILGDLPVWRKLVQLLPGRWSPPAEPQHCKQPQKTPRRADARLQAMELEHLQAAEGARPLGQQPFPRGAPRLHLHGRWRCHDYAVQVTESIGNRILTVDAKRNLKVWRAGDMKCLFHFVLTAFACHALFIQPEVRQPSEAGRSGAASASDAGSGAWAEDQAETEGVPAEGSEGSTSDGQAAESKEALALAGLAVGTAGGGIQLVVFRGGLASFEEPQQFTSHTSHGAAMVQIDYSWSTKVFASIGRDDVLKLWSETLVLLRDISFPDGLTSVSFRREFSAGDVEGGGDDLLVGFAAHVERMPHESWSRGIPESGLMLRGRTAEEPARTRRGLLRVGASDDINDHATYLYSTAASPQPEDPFVARSWVMSRLGVNLGGAAHVVTFARRLLGSVREERLPVAPLGHAREGGEVMDFRGPPVMEVGSLSGRPADWAVVNKTQNGSETQEPVVDHQRSQTLDTGDFRALMRGHPHYYDWSVSPNATVDGPRENAIRGSAGLDNVALVTSLGIGHLRTTSASASGASAPADAPEDDAGASWASRAEGVGPRRSFRLRKPPLKSPLERQQEAMAKQPGRSAQSRSPSTALAKQSLPTPRSESPLRAAAGGMLLSPAPGSTEPLSLQLLTPRSRSPTKAASPARLSAVSGPTPRGRDEALKRPVGMPLRALSETPVAPERQQPTTSRTVQLPAAAARGAKPPVKPGGQGHDGGVPRESSIAASEDEEDAWRSHRIGRGVPKTENEAKPRAQDAANTDRDSARLLEERGHLQDAPEVPEENLLKSLCTKKVDWLYYPADSEVLQERRAEIQDAVQARRSSLATWTSSGRYICSGKTAPSRATPTPSRAASGPPGRPPLNPRFCVTRAEVTEQRLIEAAMRPPPPVPDLSLRSKESQRHLRQPSPSFASSSVCTSGRSSVPGHKRRPTMDATAPPLSAR